VACFSVYAVAVSRGFGHHTSTLSNPKLHKIEEVRCGCNDMEETRPLIISTKAISRELIAILHISRRDQNIIQYLG
jgi:hypothetical protein